jgi:type IV secretory pathway VirB3-like protein
LHVPLEIVCADVTQLTIEVVLAAVLLRLLLIGTVLLSVGDALIELDQRLILIDLALLSVGRVGHIKVEYERVAPDYSSGAGRPIW